MTLRDWRKRNRVTLQRLAAAVDVSRAHLSSFETGVKRLSPDLAKRIEAFTDGEVTAASLLGVSGSLKRSLSVREDAALYQPDEKIMVELPLSSTQQAELKGLGVDIASVAQRGALQALKEARARAWREANQEAIEASNRWIEKHGTLAEQLGLI
jgi:post-segregation antitoxin (ccd killing protein)